MTSSTCYYHPKRDAKEKCDQCGALICLECEMIFNEKKSENTLLNPGASAISYYNVRHEVCPVCFFDLQVTHASSSTSPNGVL